MADISKIPLKLSSSLKEKPDFRALSFGQFFTDHMFVAHYKEGSGWDRGHIAPYAPLALDPAASVLHYGQALFEGLKAFRQKDGRIVLFRPDYNWRRMSEGAARLCMPAPAPEFFGRALAELIQLEKSWVPDAPGALYIRPTLIGSEGFLGVRPSNEYIFFTILSPVGSYYKEGVKPLKIWVEDQYLRASPGGLGAVKAAANYAASLKAAYLAKQNGYAQVLWLDVTHEYVEEVGTMNVFFVFEDEIVTPSLDGTILGGGTRDSVLTLLKSWNLPIVERKIKMREIRDAHALGKLQEVFGVGTAAVVSPVGELSSNGWKIQLDTNQAGPLAQRLYDHLTGIQQGVVPDTFQWIKPIDELLV